MKYKTDKANSGQCNVLTLWLWSFLLPLNWHGDNCLQTLTWHRVSFTVWHGFFFGTHVSRAEN